MLFYGKGLGYFIKADDLKYICLFSKKVQKKKIKKITILNSEVWLHLICFKTTTPFSKNDQEKSPN